MIWTHTELRAIEMMSQYGGSFVKTLADLCRRADETNAGRLRIAFPDYFMQYKAMVAARSAQRSFPVNQALVADSAPELRTID